MTFGAIILVTEKQIQTVLASLDTALACENCGARLRFGDRACPHCEADVDDLLRAWAQQLIDQLGDTTADV